jgi:hypothetical protein
MAAQVEANQGGGIRCQELPATFEDHKISVRCLLRYTMCPAQTIPHALGRGGAVAGGATRGLRIRVALLASFLLATLGLDHGVGHPRNFFVLPPYGPSDHDGV